MAGKGAHITQTTKAFKNLPSIFDAVATDTLNSFEAIKKFVFIFCQQERRIPRIKLIAKHYTEIYFFCNAFIQSYFLKKYGASFAEYFYGVTRINNKTNQFGKNDYYRSILSLVFFPYACEKLKAYVDKLDGIDTSERLKYEGFLKVYKNMRTIFETAKLVQILGYFSQNTSTCLLTHQLCNLRLEYVESEFFNLQDMFKKSFCFTKVISELFFGALGLSAFFIQFIQSFQNEVHINKIESLESPVVCNTTVLQSEICPICLQIFELPTVVQVSNVVYCYKCINLHFQKRGNYCPTTHYAAATADLITLYEEAK